MSPKNLIVLKNQDRKGFPLKLFINSTNSTLQQIKYLVFKVRFCGMFLFLFKHTCGLFHKYENGRKRLLFSLIILVLIILYQNLQHAIMKNSTNTNVSRGISLYTDHIPKHFCMANFKGEVIFLLLPALRATQRNETPI